MLAMGFASVMEFADGTPVVDHDGDIILAEDLEVAAHDFMSKSRDASESHVTRGVGEVVESIVLTKEKLAAMGIEKEMPAAWFIVVKVHDPFTWQKIKEGELQEFSIGGRATREPFDQPALEPQTTAQPVDEAAAA